MPSIKFSDADVLKSLGEDAAALDDDMSNVIAIEGLPVVPPKKFDKLLSVLKKKFLSKIADVADIDMPVDEEGNSYGFCFVTFVKSTADDKNYGRTAAKKAVASLHKAKMDKKHTFLVNFVADFDEYSQVPDTFDMKQNSTESKSLTTNTMEWLYDGRAQYLARYGSETEIFWNQSLAINSNGRALDNGGEVHKESGKVWTELICAWSLTGAYLTTFHTQGLALWGGANFEKLNRLKHYGVRMVEFSPKDQFLITCNADDKDPDCILVWDVLTGRRLANFDGGVKKTWPIFKWSPNEEYIARIARAKNGDDCISVYPVTDFKLLDKKPIRVPGVKDFSWSPSDNYLAYWVPEQDNVPAKVSIVSMPSRELIREKHLYNVQDVKMYWQKNGDYLCVKMTRQVTKNTTSHNFEIFDLRQKNVPVYDLEIAQRVDAFAWEPRGKRFAVVVHDGRQNHVKVYGFHNRKIVEKCSFLDRQCNSLYWAPAGTYLILAGLGTMNGVLECVDVSNGQSLAEREHFKCNNVEWDPSSRYVISSVTQPLGANSSWKYSMENGYKVWTLDGKGQGMFACTTTQALENCYQVMWRPRPPTLLNKSQLKGVHTKLRTTYAQQFEEEDEKMKVSQKGRKEQLKLEQKLAWKRLVEAKQALVASWAEKIKASGYPYTTPQDYVEVEEVIETEISVKNTIVDGDEE